MKISQLKFNRSYRFGQMTAETVFPLRNEAKFKWWKDVVIGAYGDADVVFCKDTICFTSPLWEKHKSEYLNKERLCILKKERLGHVF